ncbi:lipid-A-disaccharide kinase [Muriicola jejuensis]|uniref:Tetraacyldisaccharide 4'-kinase n=1 Tax=Muriicola jejuensis TaxID=504488 RepID=A0A6P0U804_9FLAO|nr:tetraacyldisaccharide 4'-kinase [Muriicola jejuensis]NER09265.1 tetraacyldisaccharide 4'-kinase [Muriicola jejuensis]SMP09903.1 lipid-A-disaccharide kinase [Muriicola jejuensis]
MQLLRKIAFPFSLLYGLGVYLRNLCYDAGIFTSVSPDTPTVCVGNLSTGGTGKTPMIEWMLKTLGTDRRLAVLSRGYKRRTKGFFIVHPESDPQNSGDEPLQIARKFPGVTVAVEANRLKGIEILTREVAPELILLDDAYQHRRVKARINVLLTSYSKLYTDDWYLPTGNLRDHKGQAQRADVIVVTKCPAELSKEERERIIQKLRPLSRQKLLFSTLAYSDELIGISGRVRFSSLEKREVVLVTAIADPSPLLEYLDQRGIRYRHLRFPDHHYFTEAEIEGFKEADLLLTTEKDFTRMDGRVPEAYFLPVEHRFLADGRAQMTSLLQAL